MDIISLINNINQKGISLTLNADEDIEASPKSKLTDDLRSKLKANKLRIVSILKTQTNNNSSAIHAEEFSFIEKDTVTAMLECFFEEAQNIRLKLLPEDKTWLKRMMFGEPLTKVKALLSDYIASWQRAMNDGTPTLQVIKHDSKIAFTTFLTTIDCCLLVSEPDDKLVIEKIKLWLFFIGENDERIIADIIDKTNHDRAARDLFLEYYESINTNELISKLLTTFSNYFSIQDSNLFIKKSQHLKPIEISRLLKGCIRVFEDEINKDSIRHKRQHNGRYTANSGLLDALTMHS